MGSSTAQPTGIVNPPSTATTVVLQLRWVLRMVSMRDGRTEPPDIAIAPPKAITTRTPPPAPCTGGEGETAYKAAYRQAYTPA